LELDHTPEDRFHEGMWRFARGMAQLRTGHAESAKDEHRLLGGIIDRLPESARFRRHPQTDLLSITAGILAAEIAATENRHADAVGVLERTIEVEDNLEYDEPEPWHLPARHVLGAVLLEMDRATDAERVYREALVDHPNNGWSLFGLEQALRAQGHEVEADKVHAEYERHWSRRDIWLRSSRF
jgi:predicted Zn-dependent protease